MFVILVYDIQEKRVGKVLKKCREYLNWVQNSVFEGEISDGNYKKLMVELNHIIRDDDSVIIYNMRTTRYYSREILGKERSHIDNII
jgi:CRISPR-associated protein Cas2